MRRLTAIGGDSVLTLLRAHGQRVYRRRADDAYVVISRLGTSEQPMTDPTETFEVEVTVPEVGAFRRGTTTLHYAPTLRAALRAARTEPAA